MRFPFRPKKEEPSYDSLVGVMLDRALRSPVCPICWLLREEEEKYLWTLIYEHSGDLSVHLAFYSSLGLCAHHAALLKKMVRERELITPSGVACFYTGLSSYIRESIEKALVKGRCMACKQKERARSRYTSGLVRYLEREEARSSYERSAGLCLPHMREALSAARPGVREFLKEDFLRRLEELEGRLAGLQRKLAHDSSEAPSKEEFSSWEEALWRFGGAEFEGLITGEL